MERLRFEQITRAHGLPSVAVFATAQDADGVMWLGTDAGLVRYDGRRFQRISVKERSEEGLQDNRVISLHIDDRQVLWIGSFVGLSRLDLGSDQIRHIDLPGEQATLRLRVKGLAHGGTAGTWVLLADGLYRIDPATDQLTQALALPPLGRNASWALSSDRQGGAWVAGGTEIHHLDQGGRLVSHIDMAAHLPAGDVSQRSRRLVSSLALGLDGRLWVGLHEGLAIWRSPDSEDRRLEDIEPAARLKEFISGLYVDRAGDVWLTPLLSGLLRWRQGEQAPQRVTVAALERADFNSRAVFRPFQDADGVLWIGSYNSGALLLDPASSAITRYLHVPGDPESLTDKGDVSAIALDGPRTAWLGSYSGGLQKVDLETGAVRQMKGPGPAADWIKSLLLAGPDRLWIGTEMAGLLDYDPVRNRVTPIPRPEVSRPFWSINAMVLDEQGHLVVANREGPNRLDRQGRWMGWGDGTAKNMQVDDAVNTVLSVDGAIWLGTLKGLWMWDAATARFSQPVVASEDVPRPQLMEVNSLKRDDHGRIWVGAQQGLFLLTQVKDHWQLQSWNQLKGLPADMQLVEVRAMQDDLEGQLWVAAKRGIVRIDHASRQARAFPSFALPNADVFYGAAVRHADGRILFGSSTLISIQPGEIRPPAPPPRVILSDLTLLNRSVLMTSEDAGDLGASNVSLQDLGVSGTLRSARRLTFSYRQNMIGFEFAAQQYIQRDQHRFAWRLEGFDRGWIYGRKGEAAATYTNLDPGRYVLHFMASTVDSGWPEQPTSVEIVILPPFWQTWWWYLSMTLASLAVLFMVYRFRVRSINHARARLSQEVRVRTQQVIDEKAEVDRQREAAEQARRDIGLLSEMGREIMGSLDTEAIYGNLCASLRRLMRAEFVRVFRAGGDSGAIDVVHATDFDTRLPPFKLANDDDAWLVSRCIRDGTEIILPVDGPVPTAADAQATVRPLGVEAPPGARSALLVPLPGQGRVDGVIAAYSETPVAYGPVQRDMLLNLAGYVAGALSNAHSYEQLQLAQDQLVQREKMAALGSLVAGVAHELNTPLGNSVLLATTLQDETEGMAEQASRGRLKRSDLTRFLDTARNASGLLLGSLRSAAALVRSFKHVAVDQAADLRREFDLHAVCEEIAATVAGQVRAGHHRLHIQVPEGLVMDSYPGSLGQVLNNLIGNALQHGFDGRQGGLMWLTALADEKAGQVVLVFADDGAGISPEHLPHVFEPFYTTRLGRGGSGLGLNISYNIVTSLLGGSIAVASERGQGARFEIVLPLVAPVTPMRPQVRPASG